NHVIRAIHTVDANPEAQVDVVPAIPVDAIEHDFFSVCLSCQHGRKQYPVVIDVRLLAEHSDIELVAVLQHLFQTGDPGHAIPNNYEPLHSVAPVRSTRTAHCL